MSLEELGQWLDRSPWQRISIGYKELRMLRSMEMEKSQLGYRYDDRGNTLIGEDGAWEMSWYVIGWDDLGDPHFVDINSGRFHTAIHGEGRWEPECIAMDVKGFTSVLEQLHSLSVGRTSPSAWEENPLSETEIQTFINSAVMDNKAADSWNWELWVKQE